MAVAAAIEALEIGTTVVVVVVLPSLRSVAFLFSLGAVPRDVAGLAAVVAGVVG